MKIAFFVSSLSFGGAEKQAVSDANLLCYSDLPYVEQVYLLNFKEGSLLPLLRDEVKHINLDKKNYLSSAYNLAKFIKKEKIDVVHASLFAPMIIAALATVFTSVNVVWHFHSHEFDIPLKSRLAFRWLAKLPSVKKILFVNHELMEHFSFLNFPIVKQGVLYNHSEIEPNLIKSEKADKIIHIGYLGRVVDLKRVDYLLELAVYLSGQQDFYDFKIHVVGDGDALDEIRSGADKASLRDIFVFHGFQSDVIKYYSKFDIFVNPSSEECLCMSMIDAGMMGLPVVAFDVGGNNEVIINEQTGYIVPDKNDFFAKCFNLIKDPLKRKSFGENAKLHCKKTFGKETHLKEICQLHSEFF